MNYWARDTTQSDFEAYWSNINCVTYEIRQAGLEYNTNASNSFSELESKIEQCCCNFEETRMRIGEQTVEHYVPGFNSPFVTRQSVVQAYEDQVQKRIYNDYLPEKNCGNCKHHQLGPSKTGPCDVFAFCWKDKPLESIRECIHNNRKYWIPDRNTARMMGIGYEDSEQDIHDEIECLKDRINQTKYEKFRSDLTDAHIKPMDADKPDKKYTVYDLYDLVFPDDPIKAHFDAERKRIEEKYKPQEEIAEKLEAPEARRTHPEPIPTVTYDDDMMTVLQAAVFWIGAIAFVVILILT